MAMEVQSTSNHTLSNMSHRIYSEADGWYYDEGILKFLSGSSCLAVCAAILSTNLEAALGSLHNSGSGAIGAGTTGMASIIVDEMASHIAIKPDFDHRPIRE